MPSSTWLRCMHPVCGPGKTLAMSRWLETEECPEAEFGEMTVHDGWSPQRREEMAQEGAEIERLPRRRGTQKRRREAQGSAVTLKGNGLSKVGVPQGPCPPDAGDHHVIQRACKVHMLVPR